MANQMLLSLTREVHAMLERQFGDKLHPLIYEWAIKYIPSTAGEIYDPSTHDDFVDVDTTVYRNSYRPSSYASLRDRKS